jgi:predicted  nucleic acid-binding Zn-ribbon protein
MSTPASVFRELHRLQKHASDLQEQIERGPQILKGHQVRVTRQEQAVHEAQEALKHLKVASHAKETTLKEAHQLIAKYEKQRNEATTRKEYDTLQAEISSVKDKCRKIEDDILEAMAKVEEESARLPELEKAVQKAKEEVVELEKKTKERLASYAEQLAQAREQIKQVETNLPADAQAPYQRLVAHRGGADALAVVEGRTCRACYTEITAQQAHDLLVGRLVLCKSCGRILYLAE